MNLKYFKHYDGCVYLPYLPSLDLMNEGELIYVCHRWHENGEDTKTTDIRMREKVLQSMTELTGEELKKFKILVELKRGIDKFRERVK